MQNMYGFFFIIFSVHANPFNNNLIATAGSDQFVRLFDRRYVTQENPKPFQKFVPRHLVSTFHN